MIEERYYIYRHIRNDTGQPFYIGLGTKKLNTFFSHEYKRAYAKDGRSEFWRRIVNKHGYTVEIVREDMTRQESIECEKFFIKLYGKIKDGGLLCNISAGGDGNFDYRHTQKTIDRLRVSSSKSIEKYFSEYVYPEPNTGCWLWTGTITSRGVGRLYLNSEPIQAHRAFYEYYNKPISEGCKALHKCENKLCVNPDHILICTLKDIKRKNKKGKDHHSSVLKEEDVLNIRILGSIGKKPTVISKILSLNVSTIKDVLSGRTWGSLV